MAKTKKAPGAKKIIDVTHADQAAPSDNSKSVIIAHRPMLKDPMVVESAVKAGTDEEPEKPLQRTATPDLKPLTAPPLEVAKLPVEEVPKPDKKQADEPLAKTEKTEAAKPEPKPKTEPEPESETEKPKPVDEPAEANDQSEAEQPSRSEPKGPPKKDPKKAEAEEAKQAERQAAVSNLIDSKKYYLPINSVEKRRSRRFVLLGILLSVLLALACLNVALDIGLVESDRFEPVVRVFSN